PQYPSGTWPLDTPGGRFYAEWDDQAPVTREGQLRYTTNFKQVLMCRSKGLDIAQTSFATKLSPRLIEEHLALIEEYRKRYTNLPDGESAQLNQIIERLDKSTNPNQPITKPTP
ncbi:MAG: hypothetical protein EAZ42_11965, partial [Verrucomicrobia bacterium]